MAMYADTRHSSLSGAYSRLAYSAKAVNVDSHQPTNHNVREEPLPVHQDRKNTHEPLVRQGQPMEEGSACLFNGAASYSHNSSVLETVCTVHVSRDTGKMFLQCRIPGCANAKFGRWAEFTRHHRTAHDPNAPKYWCPFDSCERGQVAGGHWFARSDKRDEHMRKVHPA